MIARTAVTVAALALLTACSSSGGSSRSPSRQAPTLAVSSLTLSASSTRETTTAPAPTPDPKSTPAALPVNRSYGAVTDLRDAAVAAGYACRHWQEDDQVTNAAESGSCSENDVFCVYASSAGLNAQIRQTRVNNGILKQSGLKPSRVLFGTNWSINNESKRALDKLRIVLGGVETA